MVTSNTQNQKNHCHWLPCTIEKDSIAPIDVYFRPTPLHDQTTTTSETKEEEANDERDGETTNVQSAAFRGRELLSRSQYRLPEQIVGSVVTLTNASRIGSEPSAKVGEVFHTVTEWEHKWDEREFTRESIGSSTVAKSIDLMRILRSVSTLIVWFGHSMLFLFLFLEYENGFI